MFTLPIAVQVFLTPVDDIQPLLIRASLTTPAKIVEAREAKYGRADSWPLLLMSKLSISNM